MISCSNAGARFMQRIEELLHSSTLPPETVLNVLRAAQANPGFDPRSEIARLEREQQGEK